MAAPYSTNFQSALVATVVAIKAAPGRLFGLVISNPNTVTIWIQMFDLAPGSVTLGTTAPRLSILVPKGVSATDAGGVELLWPDGVFFETQISVAATTAPTNAAAPTTGLTANFLLQ